VYQGKRILAIIPARAGSQRCPGKNHRLLGGKPLVLWTIEAALAAKCVDKVVVSTNDVQVMAIVAQYQKQSSDLKLQLVVRPEVLSTSTACPSDVVIHVLDEFKHNSEHEKGFDIGLLLQPTSPLRGKHDIEKACHHYVQSAKETCASFTRVVKPSQFHFGEQEGMLTQLPKYERFYVLNGAMYFFDLTVFCTSKIFVDEKTSVYEMPIERSIDIDTEEDFVHAAVAIRQSVSTHDQRIEEPHGY